MRGKGGFLRILEAFIAIAIIAGVMSFIYVSQVQKPNQEEGVNRLIRIVLEKIVAEDNLREAVLILDTGSLETEIKKFIPVAGEFDFHFSICPLNQLCNCDVGNDPLAGFGEWGEPCPDDTEVFSDERSVSVTLNQAGTNVKPKVIRVFVWER